MTSSLIENASLAGFYETSTKMSQIQSSGNIKLGILRKNLELLNGNTEIRSENIKVANMANPKINYVDLFQLLTSKSEIKIAN